MSSQTAPVQLATEGCGLEREEIRISDQTGSTG